MSILAYAVIGLALALLASRVWRWWRPSPDRAVMTAITVQPLRLLFAALVFGGVGVFIVRESIIDGVPGLAVGGGIVLLLAVWIATRAIRLMARGLRVFFYG